MSRRLLVTRASLLPSTRTARISATRQVAPVRFASSPSKPAVKTDHTKRSNSPDESPKQEHYEHGITARALEGENGASQTHPAKQPDPQPSPERSTGVQPNGPESKAGEGRVGDVHREQLDGRSMEHSVNRPARHKGTSASGRGGKAMKSIKALPDS